ncbi:Set [Carabus blaptoides fortunei]
MEYEKKPIYAKREEAIYQIPNFWLTALLNHPEISSLLAESEEEYLIHLSRLEVQVYENNDEGFKIIFYFKENPYFENSLLIKEYYHVIIDGKSTCQISSTPIMWKEGQDISLKLKERKSFFLWLTSHEYGTNDIDIAQVIKDDLWMNPLHYYLLSDNELEENSEEEDGNDDVFIIQDSDNDEKFNQHEPDGDETDNETEEYDSPTSSEITQHDPDV